jgi:hypothetical protein
MAMPLGCLISFLLPSALVSDSDAGDIGKSHIALYITIQNIIMTLCCIPPIVLMREKPPSPPRYKLYFN